MTSFTLEKVHVDEVAHFARNPPLRARTPIPLPQNGDSSPVPTSSAVGSDERITSITTHFSTYHATPLSDASDLEDWNVVPPFGRLFIRHPQGSNTMNVIVCGEPGAGAGDVVNLIIGRDVVDSQTEFKCAAMTFTVHDVTLDSKNIRIFYTTGPRDHRLDVKGYHTAIENATKLAQSLRDDGGVHLLLCCMLRTKPNRNIHRLFYETLCDQSVPTVVLVTGFASVGNSLQVDLTGICCDDHADISVVRPRSSEKSSEYECSVETIQEFLVKYTAGSRDVCLPRVCPSIHLVLKEFMSTSEKRTLTLKVWIESKRGSSVGLMSLGGRFGLPDESHAIHGQGVSR